MCCSTMPLQPAMMTLWNRLGGSWLEVISVEFNQFKMQEIEAFLQSEKADGHIVYPNDVEIFNAFDLTAFDDINVVIIGQDPYHAPGQAHGLCFSVRKGFEKIPPSLRNIYKEIEKEYWPDKMPLHGDLTGWAKQGVLLLNAALTVREAKPGSHRNKGWEEFTDAIIRAVSGKREHVVFLLWGSHAQKKRVLIDRTKHKVLETSHPSGFSAHRGFLGCGHFKEANEYLIKHGFRPVEWLKI
jgi:uracil-DNA glycosylase